MVLRGRRRPRGILRHARPLSLARFAFESLLDRTLCMAQFPFSDCAQSSRASCAISEHGAFARRRRRSLRAVTRLHHARCFLVQPPTSRCRLIASQIPRLAYSMSSLSQGGLPVVRLSRDLIVSLRDQCPFARRAAVRTRGSLLNRLTLRSADALAVSRCEGRYCMTRRIAARRSFAGCCRATRKYFDLQNAFYLYAKPERAYTSRQAALRSRNRAHRAQFSIAAIIALGDASFLQLPRRFEPNTHSPIAGGRQARFHYERGGTKRPGARIAWSVVENDSRDQ